MLAQSSATQRRLFIRHREEKRMAFIVTGTGPTGATSFTCDTAVSALEKARDLISRGLSDVLIADKDGHLYAPAEFYRFFIEAST